MTNAIASLPAAFSVQHGVIRNFGLVISSSIEGGVHESTGLPVGFEGKLTAAQQHAMFNNPKAAPFGKKSIRVTEDGLFLARAEEIGCWTYWRICDNHLWYAVRDGLKLGV